MINKMDRVVGNLNENFSWIFGDYTPGNNSGFVINRIDLCFQNLLQALELMKDHAQRYKNYTLRDQLKWPTRPIEDRMELYEKEKRTLEKEALVKDGKPVKMKAVKGESA